MNYNKIFDILVEECGAAESLRSNFVMEHESKDWPTEYRFCGKLGFGGKFWRYPIGSPQFRVSCYTEDETFERLAMIKAANDRLAQFCS